MGQLAVKEAVPKVPTPCAPFLGTTKVLKVLKFLSSCPSWDTIILTVHSACDTYFGGSGGLHEVMTSLPAPLPRIAPEFIVGAQRGLVVLPCLCSSCWGLSWVLTVTSNQGPRSCIRG